MAEKLNPFYKLLQTEVLINITSEFKETFDSVNIALGYACQLALKQPHQGKQLNLMTDASFRSAGFASWLRTIPIRKNSQSGKRTPPWLLVQKYSPQRNSKCLYTQRNFWQSVWHFLSLHTFYGKQQSQQLFWQTTNSSQDPFKQRQFRQHCGMHVIMCCNSISKEHTLLAQSTTPPILFPDWSSKARRRCVSKSGKISKQHLSRWPPLLRMSLMKNNFSSHNRTITTSQKNKPLNGRNNRNKMRSNGLQTRNCPLWKQVWKKL